MFGKLKNTFNKIKKTSIDTYNNLSKKVSDTISNNKNKVISILAGTIIGFSSPVQAKSNDLNIDNEVNKDQPTKVLKTKLNQNSIVDSLKILGVNSDFKNRSKIYSNNFSDIYKGTTKQNINLLKIIKLDSTKAKVDNIIKDKLNNNIKKEQVKKEALELNKGYSIKDIIDKWEKSAGFKKYNSLLKADKKTVAERFKKESILKLTDKVYKDFSTPSIIKDLIKSKFILKKDIMEKQKQIEDSWNKSNESKDFEKLLMENKLEEAKELKIETIKRLTAEQLNSEKQSIKKYTSIVELLKDKKIDSSYSNRKKLYTKLQSQGKIDKKINYTGTASQNEKLLTIMQASFENKTNSSIKKNQKLSKETKKIEVTNVKESIKTRTEEIDYINEDNGLKILAEYDKTKKEPKKSDTVDLSEVKGVRNSEIYANSSIGYKDNHGKVEVTPSEDSFKLNAVLEEKENYKLSLSVVHEINELTKNDTVLEASYKMLYAGSKIGTYIGITKGSNLEKFVVSQGFAFEGHKIKLSAALLNKLMTFNYGDFGDKDITLQQKAYGLDYSKSIDNNSILNEIKTSIVYFDSDGKELGVIGNIIKDTPTEYDWTEVSGGVRGGSKLLAEFTGVLRLSDKLRLDLTAGYDKTKWDKMYETLAKEETGLRYGLEAKYRINDNNQVSAGYRGSQNGIKTSSLKYDYDHGNNLSTFVEAQHLNNLPGQEDENKYKFGLKYTWGGDKRKSKLSDLYTSPSNNNKLTFSDLEPNSNVNTNDIQVYEKVIWENHIVYIDKTKLGGDSNIETNPDGTLKAINLDTGANNLVSVDNADDTAYLPYLSIKDSKFLRIEDFKGLNNLMASQGLKKGDTKTLKIELGESGGTNTLFELTLEKGSVEFKIAPAKANGQFQETADAYIGGNIIKEVLKGIFADPSADNYLEPDTAKEIINGTISSDIVNKYVSGTLSGKVLNGVTDGKFTDEQKTSLGNGTLSNEDAESIADGSDNVPNNFVFTDLTNQTVNTSVISNSITVLGITDSTSISIADGEYQINGGAWTSNTGTVNLNDTVKVRHTTSGSFSTPTNSTLTIGGVSDTFTSTTGINPIDTLPDSFTISDQDGLELNSLVESNSITVAGVNSSTPISITNGKYSISTDDGSSWSTYTISTGTVNNGDKVKIQVTTSGSYSTNTQATLNIGGVTDIFDATTKAEVVANDSIPNQFSITDKSNIDLNSLTESNSITVSGINVASTISITNGMYSISTDGGNTWSTFTNSNGTVNNSDKVKVQLTSSGSYSTTTQATLDIGGVTDIFDVVTKAAPIASDTTPDAFTFTDQNNVSLNTLTESAAITVAGINTSSPISITGGEYQINGGSWTTGNGTVESGNTVKVRIQSSSSYSTGVQASLTIGTITDHFDVTTEAAPDTVPTMGDVPNQALTSGSAMTNLDISSYVTLTDGDAISSYSLTGTLPTGLSFNSTTGILSGTPSQTGTFNLSVTATDNDGASNSNSFSITVEAAPDLTAPETSANYSSTIPTNQDVIATVALNETGGNTPAGWTKTSDTTYTKTYSSNVTETVTFEDAAGNTKNQVIEINNIDKVGASISSDNVETPANTTSTGTVTFNENVNLSSLKIVMAGDESTEVGSISINSGDGTDNITLNISPDNIDGYVKIIGNSTDQAGNTNSFETSAWEISEVISDTTAPTTSTSYSTTSPTNQNITATVTLNEAGGDAPTGWNKENDTTYTKTYSSNVTETVTFEDAAGNTKNQVIEINNIDKVGASISSDNVETPANTTSTGTVTFNENVNLSSLKIVMAGDESTEVGSISINSGDGTDNITLNISPDNIDGYVKIIGNSTDQAGNTNSFETSAWEISEVN